MESNSFWVVGQTVTKETKLSTFIATKKGWTQRTQYDPSMNNDYICNEKINDLLEWIQCDFAHFQIFFDESDALEALTSRTL